MKTSVHLSGETYEHKLAAECDTTLEAENMAEELCSTTSLDREQVEVIAPGEEHPGEALEPEDRGIWHTLIQAHLWLGLAGLGGGFLLFLILAASGIPFITENMVAAGSVFIALGGAIGLMLGGAFTLRPDHTLYTSRAGSALRKGRFVVAVHARSRDQLNEARRFLKDRHVKMVQTV